LATGSYPAFKDVDAFRRPRAVARHCPIAKTFEDRLGVFADIGVRPQIEGELHGQAITLAE